MVQSVVLILHVLVCLLIVGLVLLQRGKGADAGTGFGAGASGTVFGSRGSANFLSRTTAVLATAFFVTSLALAFFSNERQEPESLLDGMVPSGPSQAVPTERDLDSPPALPSEAPPGAETSGEEQPGSGSAGEPAPPGGAGNDR